MFDRLTRVQVMLLFVAAALLFFLPGLGAVHLFDWDEINFAEISREMILLNDYSRVHVNFEPFWEKPPLFFWMQVAAMKVFGVGEFAARLPNAICGIVILLVLVRIGERLHSWRFGALWALAYIGSVLPHLYFRSGIIDPWFNLFIFLGLYHFILAHWRRSAGMKIVLERSATHHTLLGGAFLGLAMLTKGQVAFMLFAMVIGIYWLMLIVPKWREQRDDAGRMASKWIGPFLLFCLAMVVVTCTWFGYETWKNGPWFVTEFLRYQYRLFSTPDAGHAGFPGYHFVVLLIGCFPASLFAIQEMVKPAKRQVHQNDMRRWMLILFWVVLILFTIVKSKIVHYSSMCYLPLTYLAALTIERIWTGEKKMLSFTRIGLIVVGALFAIATLVAPFIGQNIELLEPLLSKDPFAQANLEADVVWTGWEAVAGVCMLLTFILGVAWMRSNPNKAIITLFGGTAVFITVTLFFFINRIEGYSQRAAIEFFESKQDEKCYVITKNYKSYAHLFYTRKPPVTDERAWDENWLLHGDVDRPVYVICKVTSEEEVAAIGTLKEISRKNGFVMWERKGIR